MNAPTYIQQPVTTAELQDLVILATQELEDFFQRNSHLIEAYQNRLIAVALCQGAALQYIGRGYGVKDFDVHFFYIRNPAKKRLSRAVKSVCDQVGNFPPGMRVDFIRTVIPETIAANGPSDAASIIRRFLTTQPTANAWHLAKKAVVGLLPNTLFSQILWP